MWLIYNQPDAPLFRKATTPGTMKSSPYLQLFFIYINVLTRRINTSFSSFRQKPARSEASALSGDITGCRVTSGMTDFVCLAAGLIFTVAAFCQIFPCDGAWAKSSYVKDGKEYGVVSGAFRNRWWNYYERGLSFAEGEFYDEALSDLREAFQQREKDQRMARTYGMHFIDYFPNRELGVVLYEMGRFTEAQKALEISLSQFPSAKAQFYLDRVRKAIILQRGKDEASPVLTLDAQKNEIYTNADPVIISGKAEDPGYVSEITINGEPVFLKGAQQRIQFEKQLFMGQGSHEISISAKNLADKTSHRKIIIHVDRDGPLFSLTELSAQPGTNPGQIKISGMASDESGISGLFINGKEISVRGESETSFSEKIPFEKNTLLLKAQDKLGNWTHASLAVPEKSVSSNSDLLASIESDFEKILLASLLGSKDNHPPVIKLKDWEETQTVFLDKIYLEGEVRDESPVKSLSINGEPILRRAGKIIFFNHLARLKEGVNTIRIAATDEEGNTGETKIIVTRELPKALTLSERLSMAILGFESKGDFSDTCLAFRDNLVGALIEENRFKIVERERLDAILQEQKISQTELIDKDTAIKVGKLSAAQSVLTGSITETRTGIEIVARLVDTETSEILSAEDVYGEDKDLNALKTLSNGMAVKFHREFPMVSGQIVQHKGNEVFIDLGQGKVKIARRLIIYREEPIKHPTTGKILGSDNIILGRLRLIQVMPELSKAEILDEKTSEIRLMDKVISE